MWVKKIDDRMIMFLKKMKYNVVVVEDIDINEPLRKDSILIVKKVVIEARDRNELRNSLRNIKKTKNIVSVKPKGIEAARMAAHDTRVDTIILDSDTVDFLDKQQFSLMKQFNKPLEIPVCILYSSLDSSLKSVIYRRIKYYLFYTKQPLIISSRASSWNELMIPKSTTLLVSTIFGVDQRIALSYLTTYAREILVYNGVNL